MLEAVAQSSFPIGYPLVTALSTVAQMPLLTRELLQTFNAIKEIEVTEDLSR